MYETRTTVRASLVEDLLFKSTAPFHHWSRCQGDSLADNDSSETLLSLYILVEFLIYMDSIRTI